MPNQDVVPAWQEPAYEDRSHRGATQVDRQVVRGRAIRGPRAARKANCRQVAIAKHLRTRWFSRQQAACQLAPRLRQRDPARALRVENIRHSEIGVVHSVPLLSSVRSTKDERALAVETSRPGPAPKSSASRHSIYIHRSNSCQVIKLQTSQVSTLRGTRW